jgi:hypothetical protein
MKYKIDYEGLKIYLESLSKNDFREDKKIIKAHTIEDIEYFEMQGKYPEETIIQYGEPFLVDIIGNDLSVCVLTKRKYRIDGRLVGCKLDRTIIRDCHKIYDTAINGYWKIPSQFINNP